MPQFSHFVCLTALSTLAAGCAGGGGGENNNMKGGDAISYESFESGTFTLDEDPSVVLTVDVEALTFSLDGGDGTSASGTMTELDEEQWSQCCYLNGAGHTRFETFGLSEVPLAVGPLSFTTPHLSADGPLVFDAEDGWDQGAAYFSEQ